MKLKDWQRNEKTRKTEIPDGVSVAYDIDGKPLGEVEYKNGFLIRRTQYAKIRSLILLMVIFPSLAMAQIPALKTKLIEKTGISYYIKVAYPQIPSPDSRQLSTNKAIAKFVHSIFDKDLKRFINANYSKEDLKGSPNPDSLEISYKTIYWDKSRVSIYFEKYFFELGAMHPLHTIYCFNYDLKMHRAIKLSDLFKRGTPYLKELSQYCTNDLKARNGTGDDAWIKDGASPKNKNYKVFSIGKDELIIYFQEYQVASGNVGSQAVRIPFNKLSSLL